MFQKNQGFNGHLIWFRLRVPKLDIMIRETVDGSPATVPYLAPASSIHRERYAARVEALKYSELRPAPNILPR